MKENIIVDKSFDFALSIIGLYKVLQQHHESVLSKQLLRSGTSILLFPKLRLGKSKDEAPLQMRLY